MATRLLLLALVGTVAATCSDGGSGPSGPCPPKLNASNVPQTKSIDVNTPARQGNRTQRVEAAVGRDEGVVVSRETCSLLNPSIHQECGNKSYDNSCGMCVGENDVASCQAGNRKGPDDTAICCKLWKFDGFAFDYGESLPCMNERAASNAWIEPHTHDNQWTSWDANLGCKDVAFKISVVAQEAYAKNGSGGTFARREYVAGEVLESCLASIVNVPKNKKLPTQSQTKFCKKVESVILDEGVTVFKDLGRFCSLMKAETREKVSRKMYDIHPWPMEIKPHCNINCGAYGTRKKKSCGCICKGDWSGEKCTMCGIESKADCGNDKQVERFEHNYCKCHCKMPYWKDAVSKKCSSLVNMTKILDYAPGGNLKNALDVNQDVFAPFVAKIDGGNEKNISVSKTADMQSKPGPVPYQAPLPPNPDTRRRRLL